MQYSYSVSVRLNARLNESYNNAPVKVISGFRRSVNEIFALLGRYATEIAC